MFGQEWSHGSSSPFQLYVLYVLLSRPSLSPLSQLMLTLAFLTVQDEEDMFSAFSLPTLWKQSYSMTGFGLLKSALSPTQNLFHACRQSQPATT